MCIRDSTSAISVYLWLRYPDQYYIYRYSVARDISDALNFDAPPKRDAVSYTHLDVYKRQKQTYWQILPIGPTGYGDSPYQSFSAFAGNPYRSEEHTSELQSPEAISYAVFCLKDCL